MSKSRYELRGVSAKKEDVHNAIKNLDKGLFPNAFCKIMPDFVGGDSDFCNIMHADTAGTKTALAYLYYKETGDLNVWKGIVQDALVMNLDDMGCVGALSDIMVSSTIGRNKHKIPGEVVKALIEGTSEFLQTLNDHGVTAHLTGGETADVGDIVRTADVGFTTFCRMPKKDVVDINIKPGNVVVGFASFGDVSYESRYNSGIGSNGLTSARHDSLDKSYAEKYPESFDANSPMDLVYSGSKKLTDVDEKSGYEVGHLLLSPTLTYLPLLKSILKDGKEGIHGIVHCTGGAQTKVLHFAQNVRIVKNNLFDLPPVFRMIQEESQSEWEEMYQVFNMGHRLEIYCDESIAEELIAKGKEFNILGKIIGHCEPLEGKEVDLRSPYGNFIYKS